MVKRRSGKNKRKSSRLFVFLIVALVAGAFYYANNDISASTNKSSTKISESFDEVQISPDSYQIRFVDETGLPLKPDLLSKIVVTSQIKGKNCGPKNSLPDHPNGGCFTISKPVETAVSVSSNATAVFPNKLYHVNQVVQSNTKQKKYDYYFSGMSSSGSNFVIWSANKIIVRTADHKELGSVPITSNAYLQKDLTKAKTNISKFNNSIRTIKIPTSKITSVLGSDQGTLGTSVNQPALSPDIISSGYYSVKMMKNGSILSGQSYKVYNWHYECVVIAGQKEKNCTKTKKYEGEAGVSGADGTVKLRTNLINIGNDYFIGEALGDNRFRIWSKSEVVAIDENGKKLGGKVVQSPFYRPKLNLWILKVMDATKRDNNKQKMIDKYNQSLQKEYVIKLR